MSEPAPPTPPAAPVRRLIGDLVVPVTAPPIPGGAIDIAADGRIAAVGDPAALGPAPAAVERLGGMLLPGLVNAHAHTPMTLVRSVGDGLPLERWLREGVWPREGRMTHDDARCGMVLGAAEMLLSGVTTTSEMYLHEDAVADAISETGMRAVIAAGIIAALAPDGKLDGRLAQVDAFHAARHRPEARISVAYGPHSTYDLDGPMLAQVAEHAAANQALVHTHVEETLAEREAVLARSGGRTAVQALQDAGMLEGRLLVAHGVWLTDEDLATLGQAGAGMAHCPVSNLKLASGIARVTAARAAGVTVGIGTDGPASNDSLDLWEEVKLAPLLARGTAADASAMAAADALALATVEGARAIGLDDVGHLTPGAWADVVRIDLDQPATGLALDPVAHVVFGGGGRHVTDVWVAGARVVQDRSCTTVDVPAAVAEGRTRAARLGG